VRRDAEAQREKANWINLCATDHPLANGRQRLLEVGRFTCARVVLDYRQTVVPSVWLVDPMLAGEIQAHYATFANLLACP
jgi:hypothetical protein